MRLAARSNRWNSVIKVNFQRLTSPFEKKEIFLTKKVQPIQYLVHFHFQLSWHFVPKITMNLGRMHTYTGYYQKRKVNRSINVSFIRILPEMGDFSLYFFCVRILYICTHMSYKFRTCVFVLVCLQIHTRTQIWLFFTAKITRVNLFEKDAIGINKKKKKVAEFRTQNQMESQPYPRVMKLIFSAQNPN